MPQGVPGGILGDSLGRGGSDPTRPHPTTPNPTSPYQPLPAPTSPFQFLPDSTRSYETDPTRRYPDPTRPQQYLGIWRIFYFVPNGEGGVLGCVGVWFGDPPRNPSKPNMGDPPSYPARPPRQVGT
jgi:hypothetical protein